MRTAALCLVVGLAGLVGCWGTPPAPPASRPTGDGSSPDEEFRQAHAAAVNLRRRLDQIQADSRDPAWRTYPEAVALAKAHTAAVRTAGALGFDVGTAEPATPLGADALFACLRDSFDPMTRRRQALDLVVTHHPDDPRLGEYLTSLMEDSPRDAATWLPAVLDRVLAASRRPEVRQVATTARDRLTGTVGGLGAVRVRLAP